MTLAERLAAAVADGMPRARDDLARLVACRSVFNPAIESATECVAAAQLAAELFGDAGVPVTVAETPDGSLAVVGRRTGPATAPTVLLYTHHDVVPAGALDAWHSPPFDLTDRDGRWFGRGAADCKGNLVATVLALRAITAVLGSWPVTVAVVCEGSEEQTSGGMEALARAQPELVAADAIVLVDTGNIAAGQPTLTTSLRGTGSVLITVTTMAQPAHSGSFGGAAPDALQALLTTLASLRSASGETTIDGLDGHGIWDGAPFEVARFVADAGLIPGVSPLLGDGGRSGACAAGADSGGSESDVLTPERADSDALRPEGASGIAACADAAGSSPEGASGSAIADLVWARPAATVLAIDCPPIAQVSAAIQGTARAVVNLRVPPRLDAGAAQQLLVDHLRRHTPYGLVEITPLSLGQGFRARSDGPAYQAMGRAMAQAFGRDVVTTGQGGSIPLAVALADLQPDAEILLLGVEEPQSHIHGPNESVAPKEIERTALSLALFLCEFAASTTS